MSLALGKRKLGLDFPAGSCILEEILLAMSLPSSCGSQRLYSGVGAFTLSQGHNPPQGVKKSQHKPDAGTHTYFRS